MKFITVMILWLCCSVYYFRDEIFAVLKNSFTASNLEKEKKKRSDSDTTIELICKSNAVDTSIFDVRDQIADGGFLDADDIVRNGDITSEIEIEIENFGDYDAVGTQLEMNFDSDISDHGFSKSELEQANQTVLKGIKNSTINDQRKTVRTIKKIVGTDLAEIINNDPIAKQQMAEIIATHNRLSQFDNNL